ncbi:hypothetical protein L5515_017293 [Caenorhabditis briggsae]|uniref:Uncharacterized protein n=1 Tax=Caenorhabditis briggsae TaxID=6238 RepID=A0AAE9FF15_CAEBR|nr:hypothetical protein L5515_017293 [Caenorhabditis briggsae]
MCLENIEATPLIFLCIGKSMKPLICFLTLTNTLPSGERTVVHHQELYLAAIATKLFEIEAPLPTNAVDGNVQVAFLFDHDVLENRKSEHRRLVPTARRAERCPSGSVSGKGGDLSKACKGNHPAKFNPSESSLFEIVDFYKEKMPSMESGFVLATFISTEKF